MIAAQHRILVHLDCSRRTLLFFTLLFLTFILIPASSFALTLDEAMDEIGDHFSNSASKIKTNNQLVIDVKNYHSKQKDTMAKKLENKLYFALERKMPNFKLILMENNIMGLSNKNEVFVQVTYEEQGDLVILRIQGTHGMEGELIVQKEITYTIEKVVEQKLVAVLDIDSQDLSVIEKRAYSELFRSALSAKKVFQMASSADIDRMNPDEIQAATECTRDECAAIIGEQLGVDRAISSTILKLNNTTYFVSGKMIDIKDGSILESASIKHEGSLETLDQVLEELATELTKSMVKLASEANSGGVEVSVEISVEPSDAQLFVDGKAIEGKLDTAPETAFESKTYTLKLNSGSRRFQIKHPQAIKTMTKTVAIKPNTEQKLEFKLKLRPGYIALMQYEVDLSSRRWSIGWSVAGAVLFAAYASTAESEMNQALDDKKTEEDAMMAAASQEDAQSHYDSADAHKATAEEKGSTVQLAQGVAGASLALALWYWIDEPAKPSGNKKTGFLPRLSSEGNPVLAYQMSW